MATVYDAEPIDRRRKVPEEIQRAAIRVADMAIAEKNTSKVLRSQSTLEMIFYAKYLGERTIVAIAQHAGVNRATIQNLLEKGREEIEREGVAKTSYGYFRFYFYRFTANLRMEVLEKVKADALADGADPKTTMSYAKLVLADLGTGTTVINKQINNKTVNQSIQVTNQVQKIMGLPQKDQEKWVFDTLKQIGLKPEQLQRLMPPLHGQAQGEVVEAELAEVDG
jgi:hypothetical protein